MYQDLTSILKNRKLPNKSSFDIEDIVQETLITARDKSSQIQNRDDIIGWLSTIAVNKLTAETFRKKNSNNGLDFVDKLHPKDDEILKSLINDQQKNRILQKLESLYKDEPEQIKIWKMKFLEEMRYKEIEEIVGISERALRIMVLRINESILGSLGYKLEKKNSNAKKKN